MALVLGCKLGSKVRIGDNVVTISAIHSTEDVELEVNGSLFDVSDDERTLILPDVWVQLGISKENSGLNYCKLAFEAPRSIRIERLDQKQSGLHPEPGRSEIRQ